MFGLSSRDLVTLVVSAGLCSLAAVLVYRFAVMSWIRSFRKPGYLRTLCVLMGIWGFFLALMLVMRDTISSALPFAEAMVTALIVGVWIVVALIIFFTMFAKSRGSVRERS